MTDLKKHFAVIGNPIHHSLSPQIHRAFAKENGLHIAYEAILSPLDQFTNTMHKLIAQKLSGVNVTLPFKKEAYQLATTHSSHARIAEAVNTLEFKQGEMIGHNTDGIGLVRDLEQNLDIHLKNKKILLIGAGGAAEGVIYSMLEKKPSELTLTNRTIEKSNVIQKKMDVHAKSFNVHLNVIEIPKCPHQYFDVIINATSASLSDANLNIDHKVFHEGSLAYDMMYDKETSFIREAKSRGSKVSDGLGMLVEQAAEAFFIWHHIKPQTKSVIESLRAL
ncbi:shikimate dehydrogenase [Candidatus Methylopumilus universalis]|uniref:shikimate dehydrogenase n=1 Tax=Candidatus Methylopumilus universalis TaxID=2588536 RepID=UPI00112460CF|nr:shikimate dehydrogenase [Candidatus Methylopumilus universalis]QDC80693.1 shikimate dehydrogenase [Candidatus Methylopumilus universalis]QDC82002.1 shikimate dehydrogenase [Candidatus Methylopumilus universalis]QDC88436.1 shikimate dehydrogenase [Candidatus Methylopumilus universalis]